MVIFFERISPLNIIKKHFGTLVNDSTKKVNLWSEIIPLIFFCIVVSVTLPYYDMIIDQEISPYIIGGFSVAGGFLINSLMVLAEKRSDKNEIRPSNPADDLLKETFYNTAFGVFICLTSVLVCIVYPLVDGALWIKVLSGIIYFLTMLFFHTVLMVIKRLSRVFDPD